VDLLLRPSVGLGSLGAGSVHHIAFRVRDDDDQLAWRKAVEKHGLHPTPPLDRQYFRSVYFREPNGVLFELATDGPGFALDEPEDSLGRELKLPDWLEPDRPRIERVLPRIELPGEGAAARTEGDR
jgi:glyoxalase family protein